MNHPDPTRRTLRQVLTSYTEPALTTLAAFHNLSLPANVNHAGLVSDLMRVFSAPDYYPTTLATLTDLETATLTEVLRAGGTALVSNVRYALQVAGLLVEPQQAQPCPDPHRPNPTQLDDLLARLTARGLLFNLEATTLASGGYGAGNQRRTLVPAAHVFIPDEALPYLTPPPPADLRAPLTHLRREYEPRTLQRDLYLYWSYVREHGARLTTRGELYKRDLADINAVLMVTETLTKRTESQIPRLQFLRGLLHAHRLLAVLPDNTLETVRQPVYFNLPLAERTERSFQRYLTGDFINELAWVPGFTIYSGTEPLPAPQLIIEARQRVVEHLRQAATEVGPQAWLKLDGLLQRIQDRDYELLFRRAPGSNVYASTWENFNPYNPYSHTLGWGFPDVGLKEERTYWPHIEGAFIRHVLTGPLYWMGMVALGFDTEQAALDTNATPTALALTPLGAWLLGLAEAPDLPTDGGRIIVQPNFQIIALDPVSEATLAQLDQFAERLAADRAVEYQLTRESVYSGQQEGWNADEIIAFLQQHTTQPLPDNISRSLHEWQTHHERVLVYPQVTALWVPQPAVVRELQANPALADLLADPLTEHLFLLPPEANPDEVVARFHDHTWLPTVHTAKHLPTAAVDITADGLIKIIHPTPGIYLYQALAQLADALPNTTNRYQLSEASVQRAAQRGLSAEVIINRLTDLSRTPLPTELVARIRTWLCQPTSATLETVTLLHLRDHQTLHNLLADPAVQAVLEPFETSDHRALARVRTADLQHLRDLLHARGIDIAATLHAHD